jgi:hypothetical protein
MLQDLIVQNNTATIDHVPVSVHVNNFDIPLISLAQPFDNPLFHPSPPFPPRRPFEGIIA